MEADPDCRLIMRRLDKWGIENMEFCTLAAVILEMVKAIVTVQH